MSNQLLRVDASANTTDSTSRELADYFEWQIKAQQPGLQVIHRDLSPGLPQINADWISASSTAHENRSDKQHQALALSDTLIDELLAADQIVLSTPMYNFSVPASLKAWIDQIARAGKTFQYTTEGPQGLLSNKTVTILISSGGTPIGSDVDFLSGYLRQVFSFIGLSDVSLIAADRLMIDADTSIRLAKSQIDQLFSMNYQAA